ncbi:MAG: hypothetical protein GDA49_08440, partial [Rhodospirillales bacterium]|nr:hypothetical protein [Rhodospirillales bacterium]
MSRTVSGEVFFERLDRIRVLCVVLGTCRTFAETHGAQLTAQCGATDCHAKRALDPRDQINQASPDHAIAIGVSLDDSSQLLALLIRQDRGFARRLAGAEPFWTASIEPQNP